MRKQRFQELVDLCLSWAEQERDLMANSNPKEPRASYPMAVQLSTCRGELYEIIKRIASDELQPTNK